MTRFLVLCAVELQRPSVAQRQWRWPTSSKIVSVARVATAIGGAAAVEGIDRDAGVRRRDIATAIGGAAAVEIAGCCEIVVRAS